jgi:tryptophan synthase beta chain
MDGVRGETNVAGPHPWPKIVRDFQAIVGREAREQFQARHNKLPDTIAACVGGGSNAIGMFTAFLEDENVRLVGVEPAGEGLDQPGRHAATLSAGKPSALHGMKCYALENEDGTPSAVYSIASGLSYPGVGPVHSCGLTTSDRAADPQTSRTSAVSTTTRPMTRRRLMPS